MVGCDSCVREYRGVSRQWPILAGPVKNTRGPCFFNLCRQCRRDGGNLSHRFSLLILKLNMIFIFLFLLGFFLSLSVFLNFHEMIYY
jgi:hypothetical protein